MSHATQSHSQAQLNDWLNRMKNEYGVLLNKLMDPSTMDAIVTFLRRIPSGWYFTLILHGYLRSSSKRLLSIPILLYLVRKYANTSLLRGEISNNENLRAVVTGGGSGVGRSTTLLLLRLGWKVIACDKNENALKELEQIVEQNKGKSALLKTYTIDITSDDSRKEFFGFVNNEFGGGLELLVNNAGIHTMGPILESPTETIDLVASINALAQLHLIQGFLPMLLKKVRKNAIVVNISSSTALQPWPWAGSYSAAKAYVEGATQTMRIECLAANLPIKFTLVSPGPIQSPMITHIPRDQEKWATDHSDSPFSKPVKNSAAAQKQAESLGLTNSICVKVEDVARVIVEAASLDNPPERLTITTMSFEFLVNLGYWLPPVLSDRLLSLF